MKTRTIGTRQVSAIGLGAMPMSVAGHMPDEKQSIRTIHAALDAGITLIDTADAYTPSAEDVGHNERLVAKALASWGGDTSGVLIATKGGHTRVAGGGWDVDGRAEYIKRACERSLKALGVEAIDLYQHHRPDPKVAYEESIGALADLLAAGKIRAAGISNADPEQIRLAHSILGEGLVSVQNEYSPRFRTSEPEVDVCAELGLAFLPWSPLGGIGRADDLGGKAAPFAEIARERGVSPQQVCLAWELARSPVMIPIPGASRPESIRDSAAAAELELTAEELARLG
ncbi:aryl-alcohol dehydrogenase-like predicted oxidoreductase [Thermocatellispora tengchongensis]|uniref:Aryl-alcohol dehydrogenase-like predicted oxidoreductase n=1 Tax=Thermocatellispora tengchongensis TaxID=1073253 RepID=A0A840PT70_9ACTN|nr:aldo/keto reductase [Thermocatellispora tengchongensis]MBB5139135.1 aryl-alcohol dehydrogenase-like predicted oxidoreductase [Thermocatellispora tengchongensis]